MSQIVDHNLCIVVLEKFLLHFSLKYLQIIPYLFSITVLGATVFTIQNIVYHSMIALLSHCSIVVLEIILTYFLYISKLIFKPLLRPWSGGHNLKNLESTVIEADCILISKIVSMYFLKEKMMSNFEPLHRPQFWYWGHDLTMYKFRNINKPCCKFW